MIELCIVVVFAICAAFVETRIDTFEPEAPVQTSTVSDEDFASAVALEKENGNAR